MPVEPRNYDFLIKLLLIGDSGVCLGPTRHVRRSRLSRA